MPSCMNTANRRFNGKCTFSIDKPGKFEYSNCNIAYYGNEEDEYSGDDPKRACGWWKQAAEPDEYHL